MTKLLCLATLLLLSSSAHASQCQQIFQSPYVYVFHPQSRLAPTFLGFRTSSGYEVALLRKWDEFWPEEQEYMYYASPWNARTFKYRKDRPGNTLGSRTKRTTEENAARVLTDPNVVSQSGDTPWLNSGLLKQVFENASRTAHRLDFELARSKSSQHKPLHTATDAHLIFTVSKGAKLLGVIQLHRDSRDLRSRTEAALDASIRHHLADPAGSDPRSSFWSIGYHFLKEARGIGAARETVEAVLKFAFEELQIAGVHAQTERKNVPALEFAAEIGFERVDHLYPGVKLPNRKPKLTEETWSDSYMDNAAKNRRRFEREPVYHLILRSSKK